MKKPSHFHYSKIVSFVLVLVFVFSLIPASKAQSQDVIGGPTGVFMGIWTQLKTKLKDAITKVGSKALKSAVTKALNKIAYDTATYIGSGGEGQKPLFVEKGWGSYLEDIADNAAGDFIDQYAQAAGVNFCEPDLNVKLSIGLGLVDAAGYSRPKDAYCTFSKMTKAWKDDINEKYASMRSPTFLKDLSTMFDPTGNGVNMALTVMSGLKESTSTAYNKSQEELSAKKGWLDVRDIGGKLKGAPGEAEEQKKQADASLMQNVGKFTGDTLVDAANVFLNQLAITAFNKAKAKLLSGNPNAALSALTLGLYSADKAAINDEYFQDWFNGTYTVCDRTPLNKCDVEGGDQNQSKCASGYTCNEECKCEPVSVATTNSGAPCLDDPNCDPNSFKGMSSVQANLSQVIQPKFDTRGDYSILGDLATCPDPQNMGATNCVIDDQFRQGIEDRKTVAEALNEGFLQKNWRLKRDVDYNQGYSLRNLLILRKFRIIPVGWETALLKAEENNVNVTMLDMVSCFDPDDNYNDFSQGFTPAAWCQGLVDPNWVLKAPLNYCKRQGAGGQILEKTLVPEQKIETDDGNGGISTQTIPGQVIITRNPDYCADEQSCIKEKTDGTCEAYGYCTEEKRTWDFDSDSCDAVFNTCQNFVKPNGKIASYLENTLDYSTCTSDNAGCRPYSSYGTYTTSTDKVAWAPLQQIYFSKKVETCDKKVEGCNEFIRIQPDAGHNFIHNGDMEGDLSSGDWTNNIDLAGVVAPNNATTTSPGYFSNIALKLSEPFKRRLAVGPNDYNIAGQVYTVSFYAKDCNDGDSLILGASSVDDREAPLYSGPDWQYYYVSYNYPINISSNEIYFAVNSSACVIDRVKVEMAKQGTTYSDYYTTNLAYQKLIPNYLAADCYVNPTGLNPDYRLKSTAPAKCLGYARLCNGEEAGCNFYTSVRNNFSVPAKTTATDACRSECVGYDYYVQKEGVFNYKQAAVFIPATARKCRAVAAGCSEFTNLDEVVQGGEAKEYYAYLRQCVKPEEAACGVFYSWGNIGTAGYQLQPFNLQASNDKPVLTSGSFDGNNNQIDGGVTVCDPVIYNTPANDAAYNSDCRQFYNKAGAIFYALYSTTITCADNCHPYRLTEAPVDETLSQAACTGSDKNWNAQDGVCNVCKNRGVWDSNQNGCIYKAIPGEGLTCTAAENGCREYNGNYGNNVRSMESFSFEDNKAWASYCADSSALNVDSINRNGHSLQYNFVSNNCSNVPNFDLEAVSVSSNSHGANKVLATVKGLWQKIIKSVKAQTSTALPGHGIGINVDNVSQGKAYTVKFLAKANSNVSINIYLANGSVASQFETGEQNSSVSVVGNGEWRVYQANLDVLDHEVTEQEALIISASGNVLLDNIVLNEISDRYYLIKDSWSTPNSCYYDMFDQYQGINYNIGCESYTDNSNNYNYLRNFTNLCTDDAVGCELMVITGNSANPEQEAYQENGTPDNNCDPSDGPDCIEIPADRMAYVRYENNKGKVKNQCTAVDKGCSRLGDQVNTNVDVSVQNIYQDVYVKNNPDKYATTLCGEGEVGCQEWKYLDGSPSYFKDPGENVCEWRQSLNASGMNLPKKWYKKPVKRCDFDPDVNPGINVDLVGNIIETQNKLCTKDEDCGLGKCILDKNDYLCPVDSLKTIGLGGGNLVYQPSSNVGLCEYKASACTEYIDPVSEFSPNIVVNPTWSDINSDGISGDGWSSGTISSGGTTLTLQKQDVYLLKNKLYSLSVETTASITPVILNCPASIRQLQADNSFAPATNQIVIGASAPNTNILFSSLNNTSCTLYGGANGKKINIRGTVVDYRLSSKVDKQSCNGEVNFDNGCILFNERRQEGANGLVKSNWRAYGGSYSAGLPATCDPLVDSTCDSNVLIKVQPNRICSRWLACMSIGIDPNTGEETCYALGECDKLNDFGRCQSFIKNDEVQHTFNSGADRNISGYSKLDYYYLSNMSEVGEDPNMHWDFENGPDFPGSGVYNSPGTWTTWNSSNANAYIMSDSSELIPSTTISYPAHGKGLLMIDRDQPYSSGGVVIRASYPFKQGRQYYINFLVNIDDSNGKGASVLAEPSTGSNFGWMYITSGSGWQRKVYKFVPQANFNDLNIILSAGSGSASIGNEVYFDDINIEPVLEVADNSYIAKECRLYPKQDSLTCKSAAESVVSNGIYGYCLEHDPKNPDVCLMWYPIENVKSSQASTGASSGFSSIYGDSYYCAEMSTNFEFTERRSAFLLTAVDDSNNGCSFWSGFQGQQDCPTGYERFVMRWHREGNNKCSTDYYCIPMGQGIGVLAMCDPNDASANIGDTAGCASYYTNPQYTNSTWPSWNTSNAYVAGGSYTGGPGGWDAWILVNSAGYYQYNGTSGHSHDSEVGTNLIDRDDNPPLGTFKLSSSFTPKCTKFLKMDKPWVQRLTSFTATTSPFFTGAMNNYNRSLDKAPYGSSGNDYVPGYQVGSGAGKAGWPYSCNNGGQLNAGVDMCKYVSTNLSVNALVQGPYGHSGTFTYPASNLKQIFLKGSGVSGYSYDCMAGINCSGSIPPCNGNGSARASSCLSNPVPGNTCFCGVYPTIYNIKVRNSEGLEIVPVNGLYPINTSDFYTVSFGVDIDSEQLPVGELFVDFDDNGNGNVTTTQIDPSTNYRFIHYYNPQGANQQYQIRIKAVDNWGFYKCAGLASTCPDTAGCCSAGFTGLNCAGCIY